MKKFILYFLSVIIGVTIVDITYRFLCDRYYKNPPQDSFVRTNYTFVHCDTPSQLVVLGASTAQRSYVTQILEDSLGISCYNMGWYGRSVLYQYLSLMKAIENGGLETVLLNLSASQLSDEWVKDRIADLYPYYWSNDTIRNIVNEVENMNMGVLMCSSLIQYNSSLDKMFRKEKSKKGYIPLPYTGKPVKDITINDEIPVFNDIAVKYLKIMSNECKERNIRLIVCLSPSLETSDSEINALLGLCKDIGIETWNFVHTIQDPILFKDGHHLNEKGAEKYTEMIVTRLRDIVKYHDH